LVTADIHEEVGVLLDASSSLFVHLHDLVVKIVEERGHHQLNFDLLFVLTSQNYLLAVLFSILDLLEDVVESNFLVLLLREGFDKMCSFPHSYFNFHI
jgi:hypothetical protein